MIQKILLAIGAITLIGLVGMIGLEITGKSETKKVAVFEADDPNRPIAVLDKKESDLGKIKLADTKVVDFNLKNDGKSPLNVANLSTSCGCTSVKVSYKDQNSKEISMHQPSDFEVNIAPGESAKITLTYRPFSMPVEGAVERIGYLKTNDPANKDLELVLKAIVEK